MLIKKPSGSGTLLGLLLCQCFSKNQISGLFGNTELFMWWFIIIISVRHMPRVKRTAFTITFIHLLAVLVVLH
jgi:hypothetical protein